MQVESDAWDLDQNTATVFGVFNVFSESVNVAVNEPAPKIKGRALFDFTAGAEDQLGFKKGAFVTVIEKGPSGGWSKGLDELTGRFGYFPSDYIQV